MTSPALPQVQRLAIETDRLGKRFGTRTALDGVAERAHGRRP